MQNYRGLRNNNKIKAVAMTCEKMLRPKPRPDDRPPFRSPFSHYLNPLGGVTANSPWLYIYSMSVCGWWAARGGFGGGV